MAWLTKGRFFAAVGFALSTLFCYWVGIELHAYYVYKAYGLMWFENQLPSIAEVSGEALPYFWQLLCAVYHVCYEHFDKSNLFI
jgi:hypothetical protein